MVKKLFSVFVIIFFLALLIVVPGLKADGKFCSEDWECSSMICCEGVCKDSCIIYSNPVKSLFSLSHEMIIAFEVMFIIGMIIIISILRRNPMLFSKRFR